MISPWALFQEGQDHFRRRVARSVISIHSFTLVELLLVILIIFVVMGMVGSMVGLGTIQGGQVKLAAEQLAAVLRQTRQMAMDHQTMYGVTFNITNAPGSTGQVLNNRSGGHWYRVLGPHDFGASGWSGYGGYRRPNFSNPALSTANPASPAGFSQLGPWLASIQADFIGPKYVLPQRQVRFISLTDEDNGNNWCQCSAFEFTYPRPWFGNFVKRPGDANPRLYAWGGYDSGFQDNDGPLGVYWRASTNRNPSGFYYQGSGPPIVGCVNPQDTPIVDDPAGSGAFANANGKYQTLNLLPAGQSRALVNGDWLDCLLLFMPDGSCVRQDWMQMRHAYGSMDYQPGTFFWNLSGAKNIQFLAPGDRCNGFTSWDEYYAGVPYNNLFEASDYDNVTGMYYITLGPDVAKDTVNFSSASQALASMMPMYRVGVSRQGEVRILKVARTMPAGTTLDPKWQGTVWRTGGIGNNGYWNNLALSANGESLVPAESFVTPEMMSNMQWWIDP